MMWFRFLRVRAIAVQYSNDNQQETLSEGDWSRAWVLINHSPMMSFQNHVMYWSSTQSWPIFRSRNRTGNHLFTVTVRDTVRRARKGWRGNWNLDKDQTIRVWEFENEGDGDRWMGFYSRWKDHGYGSITEWSCVWSQDCESDVIDP